MQKILVGIDGSERGERALRWALHYAHMVTESGQEASLTLLTVITGTERQRGLNEDLVEEYANRMLEQSKQHIEEDGYDCKVVCSIARGKIVDSLIDAAADHSLIVMGSHHGFSIGQTIGGAKGLRVAVSSAVPTVVVPVDWVPDESEQAKENNEGIVCAVGFDDSSNAAVAFAADQAAYFHEPLRLITAWGIPAFLQDASEMMGGGISPVGEEAQRHLDALVEQLQEEYPELSVTGEAIEGASQTRTIIEQSRNASLLVLGTHSYRALGRALFGSITHSVLLNLVAPTVVVPLNKE